MMAHSTPEGDRHEDPKLLTVSALAKRLSVSVRQIHRLNRSALIPGPLRIGRCTRWRAAEVAAWLRAGSPPRCVWESLQQAKTETGATT